MSRIIRKPTFCICENKDADQLRGDRDADQRLCFRYIDKNSGEVLSKLKDIGYQATSLSTYDFSTLYTT